MRGLGARRHRAAARRSRDQEAQSPMAKMLSSRVVCSVGARRAGWRG